MRLEQAEIAQIAEAFAPHFTEALAQIREEAATLSPERIAYYEPEAAQLCGVPSHVLRDARFRGEITGSRLGKRVVYERSELLRFIRGNREQR